MNEQTMEMEKEQLNGKIMDREDIKHTFKTRYLNSDKVTKVSHPYKIGLLQI